MPRIPNGDPLTDAPGDRAEVGFEAVRAVGRRLARWTVWVCLTLLVVLAFWGAHDLDHRLREARHDSETWSDLEAWCDLDTWATEEASVQSTMGERAVVALRLRGLQVPVRGIEPADLVDSFGDARGGGRRHRAIDITAPKGTPVLATGAGRITSKSSGGLAGKYLFQVDETGSFVYYYAHLDGWSWGLEEGDRVRRGDVLGYVGTTGNAPVDGPHLHFAIYKVVPGRRGPGIPINPWRVLAAAR